MIDRYEKVLKDNNPEEIKELLSEYYQAMKRIQEIDELELEHNSFWIDNQTTLGLFLSMTVDELVNDTQ